MRRFCTFTQNYVHMVFWRGWNSRFLSNTSFVALGEPIGHAAGRPRTVKHISRITTPCICTTQHRRSSITISTAR